MEKKPWQSKTLWMSVVSAIVPLVCPPCAVWIAANPEVYSAGLGLLFTALRVVTQDKIVIS